MCILIRNDKGWESYSSNAVSQITVCIKIDCDVIVESWENWNVSISPVIKGRVISSDYCKNGGSHEYSLDVEARS